MEEKEKTTEDGGRLGEYTTPKTKTKQNKTTKDV